VTTEETIGFLPNDKADEEDGEEPGGKRQKKAEGPKAKWQETVAQWRAQQGLPCLYRALEVAGLSDVKLAIMRPMFLRRRISRMNIKLFAAKAEVCIVFHDLEGDQKIVFGEPEHETVHIHMQDRGTLHSP